MENRYGTCKKQECLNILLPIWENIQKNMKPRELPAADSNYTILGEDKMVLHNVTYKKIRNRFRKSFGKNCGVALYEIVEESQDSFWTPKKVVIKSCVPENEMKILMMLRNCSFVPPMLASKNDEFVMPYAGEDFVTFREKHNLSVRGQLIMDDFIRIIMRHIHFKYKVFHCDLRYAQITINQKMEMHVIDFGHGKYQPWMKGWDLDFHKQHCRPGPDWTQKFMGH